MNGASEKSAAPAAGYAQSVERAAMAAAAAAPEYGTEADAQSEAPREVTDMADAPSSAAPPAAPMAPAPAAADVSGSSDAKTNGEAADKQPSVFTAAQAPEAALGDYFAVVHLTGDAARADALAGLEPVALADGRRGYELDRTQYEALLRELGQKGAQPETEEFDTASETALAVVEE